MLDDVAAGLLGGSMRSASLQQRANRRRVSRGHRPGTYRVAVKVLAGQVDGLGPHWRRGHLQFVDAGVVFRPSGGWPGRSRRTCAVVLPSWRLGRQDRAATLLEGLCTWPSARIVLGQARGGLALAVAVPGGLAELRQALDGASEGRALDQPVLPDELDAH